MSHPTPSPHTPFRKPSIASIVFFFLLSLILMLLFWFGMQAMFQYAPRNPEPDPDAKRAAERIAILQKIQEEEATNYNKLAWKDPAAGIVQIPVPVAMELIVQRAANNPPRPAYPINPATAPQPTPTPEPTPPVETPAETSPQQSSPETTLPDQP